MNDKPTNAVTFKWLMDESGKDLEAYKKNPNKRNKEKVKFWISKLTFERRLIQQWRDQMDDEIGEGWKR